MSKVQYTDKTNAQSTATPTTQKVSAADMNELKAAINALYDERGWGYYQDDDSTQQTITTSEQKLTIDTLGSSTNTDYLPTGLTNVSTFWDSDNNKITPEAIGDGYDVRLDMDIDSKSGNPGTLTVQLDIGGQSTPTIVINERSVSLSKTPPYKISVGFPIFTLATFVTNGGQLFLSTDSGSIVIGERGVLVKRDYASIG